MSGELCAFCLGQGRAVCSECLHQETEAVPKALTESEYQAFVARRSGAEPSQSIACYYCAVFRTTLRDSQGTPRCVMCKIANETTENHR